MGPGVCCEVPPEDSEEDSDEEDSAEDAKEEGSKTNPNLEFAVGGFRTWVTWHAPAGAAEACRRACGAAEQAAKDGDANAELLRQHACRVVAR